MSNLSIVDKLKNALIPSAFAGAASVGVYYIIAGQDLSGTVPFASFEVPIWGAVAGSSALGTLGGEILTEFVLPMIPKNQEFAQIEEHVIPPVAAGLTTYAAMNLLVSSNTSFINAFIIGSGGSVGGKYLYGMTGMAK